MEQCQLPAGEPGHAVTCGPCKRFLLLDEYESLPGKASLSGMRHALGIRILKWDSLPHKFSSQECGLK